MRFAWFSSASQAALIALALGSARSSAGAGTVAAPGQALGWSMEAARTVARPPGVRVLVSSLAGDSRQTIAALEGAGYSVEVAVLPSTFYVRPRGGAGALPDGVLDATTRSEPAVRLALDDDPFQGRGDAFPPSDVGKSATGASRAGGLSAAISTGLFYGTRWHDTSEFMIGRVAVPLLFPESDGSFDTDRYSWTPALRDSVIRSAVRGFLKWTSFASLSGVPLTFLIEVHPVLPTRYEPIDHPVAQEDLWIEDALEPLVGYRGDAVAMGYDVANAARARLGAQWAAVVLAVQNDTDPDGTFPDGFIAHAKLGGPYFVLPINNLNTRSATLDFYMEHEMTHMFWALDEFPANNAWWACTWRVGYFNQPNSNSELPAPGYCGVARQCVMKGNYPDSVCAPTLRQIGWVDLDQSGGLDLFETRPAVLPDSARYSGTAGVPIAIRGAAVDLALPNQNPNWFGTGDSITIATVDSIWQRIDGGPWVPVAPDDGIFDEGAERFTLLLPSQVIGNHLLEFQALNSNGRQMAIPGSALLTISGAAGPVPGPEDGAGPAVSRLDAGPTPSAGRVRFSIHARSGSTGTARLYDVSGRLVRAWSLELAGSTSVAWEWDGRLERGGAGAGGLYFLVVRIGPERLTRHVVLLR